MNFGRLLKEDLYRWSNRSGGPVEQTCLGGKLTILLFFLPSLPSDSIGINPIPPLNLFFIISSTSNPKISEPQLDLQLNFLPLPLLIYPQTSILRWLNVSLSVNVLRTTPSPTAEDR